ncbi:MAG: phosphoenolpyruvate synthase [Pirellulales bacterium]
MPQTSTQTELVRAFADLTLDDIPSVGGKNASLGEMVRELSGVGIQVPDGFAITADAYRQFLSQGGLDERIRRMLEGLNTHDVADLHDRATQVRQAIVATPLPSDLQKAILAAYRHLSQDTTGDAAVAVRSSATAEDLPDASFAGQQETYLNVQGQAALLDACRRCFASLFTDRAISYRVDKGFDHFKIGLSVGVQLMVRSDLASSGIMFTIDTESGFRDAVLITSSYGLGETIVQGSVNPDEFVVFKPTLKTGHRPLLRKTLGSKEFKLVLDPGGGKMVKTVPVPAGDRSALSLGDDDVLKLARWGCQIEDHYTRKHGRFCPMDIEWAKDGTSGEIYIVQARPETVQARKDRDVLETYRLKTRGKVLISGQSVGDKIAQGPVRIVADAQHLGAFRAGEVLVTDKTDPDWEPVMKKAAAIVTNRGGRTCHAAIVSRELGLPAVVGTQRGTHAVRDGQQVTISCAEGDTGFVYDGKLDFTVDSVQLSNVGRPRTKIMVNVANPDEAFALSMLPNDGVGLARIEFIIANSIAIHPLALLEYDRISDRQVKARIDELTAGYEVKPQYFVDRLAQGVAMLAAAFYPKDVIVRLSDFKTNEYANLIGGRQFEPVEENPMIGFRGASRYYDERFREAFGLECQALRQVRETMGLTNVKVMVPFCRTVAEGRRVLDIMARHGLERGKNGLEVYVMCEIPSNVVCAAEFAEIFDGFSIGSNDLTQLTLGVDRDSEIVAHVFDERDPAVTRLIAAVIAAAHAAGRKIGICGQAPSDYPEFAEFLVHQGIDSMSLNADAVVKTTLRILELEKSLTGTPAAAT